jgi:hypothetical protein
MSSAVSIVHEKVKTEDGVVVEIKIWKVPKSDHYPEGVKYSFFATQGGKVLVGYDNHKPKGHHRHFGGIEGPYFFAGFDKLRNDFLNDLSQVREKKR